MQTAASLYLLPKPREHFPYFHGEVAHALTSGRAALFIVSTVVSTIEHSQDSKKVSWSECPGERSPTPKLEGWSGNTVTASSETAQPDCSACP